jgi:hypothetical protein
MMYELVGEVAALRRDCEVTLAEHEILLSGMTVRLSELESELSKMATASPEEILELASEWERCLTFARDEVMSTFVGERLRQSWEDEARSKQVGPLTGPIAELLRHFDQFRGRLRELQGL